MRPSSEEPHAGDAHARPSSRFPVVALVSVPLLVWIAFVIRAAIHVEGARVWTLADDAMISMRYAANLAAGDGLVFNPGDAPVEGITNPLWAVAMAGIHAVVARGSPACLCVSLLGVLLLLTNLGVCVGIARRLAPDVPQRVVDLMTVAAVGLCYPLAFWTLRGFEVGAIALVVDSLVLLALRVDGSAGAASPASRWGAMLLGVVAVLLRMDAAVACTVVGAWCLWRSRRQRSVGWIGLAIAGGIAIGLLALTAWRLSYYGELLPNTYALKVAHVPWEARLGRGLFMSAVIILRSLGPWLLLAAAGAWAVADRSRRLLPCAVFFGQLAYSCHVGGDVWERMGFANRFLAVGLCPLLVVAAIHVAEHVAGTKRRRATPALRGVLVAIGAAAVAAAALLYVEALPSPVSLDGTGIAVSHVCMALVLAGIAAMATSRWLAGGIARAMPMLRQRAILGLALILAVNGVPWWHWATQNFHGHEWDRVVLLMAAEVDASTDPDAVVAVTTAGTIPYFTERRYVDLLGKVDPVIANTKPQLGRFVPGHDKWDLGWSIDRYRPDVIVRMPSESGAAERRDAMRGRCVSGLNGFHYLRDSPLVTAAGWTSVAELDALR